MQHLKSATPLSPAICIRGDTKPSRSIAGRHVVNCTASATSGANHNLHLFEVTLHVTCISLTLNDIGMQKCVPAAKSFCVGIYKVGWLVVVFNYV